MSVYTCITVCYAISLSLLFTHTHTQGRMAGQWLCAGRPICDVRISAKELIRAKSYDLAGKASSQS